MRRIIAAGLVVGCLAGAGVAAQGGAARGATTDIPRQRPPRILDESLAGRDSFDRYCAPCHGVDGRGAGPVASALKTRPSDLTQLARRNGGQYPSDRVAAFVAGSGRALPAHGSAEMPIWGSTFRVFEADARVQERIKNLVTHVGSMQQPTSAPNTTGAQLFRTYCASCHGTGGVGDGPVGDRLRQRPPDLTRFTERNGGMFPSERVGRIVDGRDVPSHGDREMPVWGDAFRSSRQGLTADEVRARIAAIVAFLEAIQRRNG